MTGAVVAQEALRHAGISLAARGTAHAPLDTAARGPTEVLRAAPQAFNSEAEIAAALAAVARLAARR